MLKLLLWLPLAALWIFNARHPGPTGGVILGIYLVAMLRLFATDSPRRPAYYELPESGD